MSKGVIGLQAEGKFGEMSERDREIQASIWALIFLVSELSLGHGSLIHLLKEKGLLTEDDHDKYQQSVTASQQLERAYAHVESAFGEKYEKVRQAMEHPEEVQALVEQKEQESKDG